MGEVVFLWGECREKKGEGVGNENVGKCRHDSTIVESYCIVIRQPMWMKLIGRVTHEIYACSILKLNQIC